MTAIKTKFSRKLYLAFGMMLAVTLTKMPCTAGKAAHRNLKSWPKPRNWLKPLLVSVK